MLPPRCVQHRKSRCAFISIQLRGTRLPLPWTSMRFTCQMFVWAEVALFQERALSPAPVYLLHTWALTCTHKHRYYSTPKFNSKAWWMRVSSQHVLISFFFFANTHSLCWVTHACHFFKKPSTWIYILTLWSPMSLLDCEHNGDGWELEKLTGIKRKG